MTFSKDDVKVIPSQFGNTNRYTLQVVLDG